MIHRVVKKILEIFQLDHDSPIEFDILFFFFDSEFDILILQYLLKRNISVKTMSKEIDMQISYDLRDERYL
ncbi:unnamed protein product [Trifolium pratense]|uniref:Uncharacterized protein n=1 Tax=Trifolium pratense TaxID=57577 RepID=A0ACB0J316_TRIPR|nr:unnamed protein product [Trifolium pratense]